MMVKQNFEIGPAISEKMTALDPEGRVDAAPANGYAFAAGCN
jgi:hypothetical protein